VVSDCFAYSGRWEGKTEVEFQLIVCEDVDRTHLAEDWT
jgi:hypothetical protein